MTAYDDLMAEDAPPPEAMLGDKGYDSDAIRSDLEWRGIDPVIPTKSNRKVQRIIDKAAYAMRNGTLICDLERRRTIALLHDREPATAQAWLSDQSKITVVARDRGGGYGSAVAKALPKATQVADRWHLMENASRAFLDAVRKSMRQVRAAIGAATINPDLLTAAERIQYEGYLRREDANAVILGLARGGITIKEIVRRTGHSRGLVRKVLRGQHTDVFRVRESSLELHLPWLDAQWAAGERNGAELWRRLRNRGFRGCLRVVSEWAARRRRAEEVDGASLSRAPSVRTIARFLTVGRDRLSRSE